MILRLRKLSEAGLIRAFLHVQIGKGRENSTLRVVGTP